MRRPLAVAGSLAFLVMFFITAESGNPPLISRFGGAGTELRMTRDGYDFEIKLDPGTQQVNVYTFDAPLILPRDISLSLFKDPNTQQTVELHSILPPDSTEKPHYQGKLDGYSGPYVAFEIQFSLPDQTWKRLKAEIR